MTVKELKELLDEYNDHTVVYIEAIKTSKPIEVSGVYDLANGIVICSDGNNIN